MGVWRANSQVKKPKEMRPGMPRFFFGSGIHDGGPGREAQDGSRTRARSSSRRTSFGTQWVQSRRSARVPDSPRAPGLVGRLPCQLSRSWILGWARFSRNSRFFWRDSGNRATFGAQSGAEFRAPLPLPHPSFPPWPTRPHLHIRRSFFKHCIGFLKGPRSANCSRFQIRLWRNGRCNGALGY